jgi:hypothetical protein
MLSRRKLLAGVAALSLFPHKKGGANTMDSPVLATIPGPAISLPRKLGLSLMWRALKRQRRSLNREVIESSSATEKNRGARL